MLSEAAAISDGLNVVTTEQTPTTQFELAQTLGMSTSAVEHPRVLTEVHEEIQTLIMMDGGAIADECNYYLPRGEGISGPSTRFAEIVAWGWRNCTYGGRVISISKKYVTTQGVFCDQQRNTRVVKEVSRRITDKFGKTFSDDMTLVTSNAAVSIALRNAVLTGIPKAMWLRHYNHALKLIGGDADSLAMKKMKLQEAFTELEIKEDDVLKLVDAVTWADVGVTQIRMLRGFYTAINKGEASLEGIFADKAADRRSRSKVAPAQFN